MTISVRAITQADRQWIRELVLDRWGAEFIVSRGVVHYPHKLDGFVAEGTPTKRLGLATYVLDKSTCELVTLDSVQEGEGIGTALVQAVAQHAALSGCSRLWCVTTNDNFPALRFYQKRGLHIVAVHPGAVDRSRVLKPSIPLWGIDSVPIRDEIELELNLHPSPGR
jgi:GNAT superfamily N-acetyltransferase